MKKLEICSISKFFPGVVALDKVSFEINLGECHCIVGENGAGKSTLGRILAGIYQPDEGYIVIDGQRISFYSPVDAKRFGISMVHQELLFCPNLSVAENLFLGSFPSRAGFLQRDKMEKKAKELLSELGIQLDVWQIVENLSIAQKQMVQIASAISSGARIIIMDEPTSSLSQIETERLFNLIKLLKERGVTVIYISHRLEEVFRISERITVLRDGKYIDTLKTSQTNENEIISKMVGRNVDLYCKSYLSHNVGRELLRVENLSVGKKIRNISFSLHEGEILGLAGLVGAGRSEIAKAIFGLEANVKGEIFVEGEKVKILSPRDAISLGIGFVPEDRKLQGLVLSMTAGENLTLPIINKLQRFSFIQRYREECIIKEYFNKLSVKPPNYRMNIATFSGGNQQKVVLSKWLALNCKILIMDEPTRGIDVKAKQEIHMLMCELVREGKGILLISSELPELLNLSTRILVVRDGRICGEFLHDKADQESLLKVMAGVTMSRQV
jgi:ABC-type sugar transport system ATPase subunit